MREYDEAVMADWIALRQALHVLSQPLSSLVLLLELAGEDDSEPIGIHTLQEAREQCARTLQAFDQLRALVRAAQPA